MSISGFIIAEDGLGVELGQSSVGECVSHILVVLSLYVLVWCVGSSSMVGDITRVEV